MAIQYIAMSFMPVLLDQNPWWISPTARQSTGYQASRDFRQRLSAHAQSLDRRALVVLGPRQVGKTVALKQLIDELLDGGWPAQNVTYFDFSDERLTALPSPREVASFEPAGILHDRPRLLVLDEINKAARWQDWLKQSVDTSPALRVIATGSIAGALRSGSRESGQGRWDEMLVGGLTYAEHLRFRAPTLSTSEVRRRFPNELERYLNLGGFPEHVTADTFADVARARSRIREDIADRAIARDLAESGVDVDGARRLFVFLAAQSGAIFSALERARDLKVDERTVKGWLERLIDAQLVCRLEAHSRGAAQLRAKPKIYAVDHGMVGAFAVSPDRRRDHGVSGRIVETVVVRHLRAIAEESIDQLSFFRSVKDEKRDTHEADLILPTGNGPPIVVEVTSSASVKPEKIKRTKQIGKKLATNELILVHGGIHFEERDGVRCIPLEQFLLDPGQIGTRDG